MEKKIDNSPYKLHCPIHGEVTLSDAEAAVQLLHASARWICPKCGSPAPLDQGHYDTFHYEYFDTLLTAYEDTL